jgi:hypothetical protein
VNGLKKMLLILTLVSGMIFSAALTAMANSFYFDGMFIGNWKVNNDIYKTYDDALRSYTIGGEYFLDKQFKIAGEFTFGKMDDYYGYYFDEDFSDFLIKGGYKVLSDKRMRVDGTLAYYTRKYDGPDRKLKSILIGADARYYLDKKSYLQGSFGYSISGDFDDYNATVIMFSAKYVNLFSKNLGGAIGYRYNKTSIDNVYNSKITHSGLTIGAVYKY